MLTHYPTKRSVLVPTLLYAQDEIGHLNDEAILEIAGRLDLTELEVRNVISYYSLLRTKPAGKYVVQVCTNISCMLRGAEEVFEHCKQRLGVDHKEVTRDGTFSVEEVECNPMHLSIGEVQVGSEGVAKPCSGVSGVRPLVCRWFPKCRRERQRRQDLPWEALLSPSSPVGANSLLPSPLN